MVRKCMGHKNKVAIYKGKTKLNMQINTEKYSEFVPS